MSDFPPRRVAIVSVMGTSGSQASAYSSCISLRVYTYRFVGESNEGIPWSPPFEECHPLGPSGLGSLTPWGGIGGGPELCSPTWGVPDLVPSFSFVDDAYGDAGVSSLGPMMRPFREVSLWG